MTAFPTGPLTEMTNCTGVDPVLSAQLNVADANTNAVDRALTLANIEPGVEPNIAPNDDPNLDPNAASTPHLTKDDSNSPESATDSHTDDLNADSWRVELAVRLDRYRSRRKPRPPRYPSLVLPSPLLPFDASESSFRPARNLWQATGSTTEAALPQGKQDSQAKFLPSEETPAGAESFPHLNPQPSFEFSREQASRRPPQEFSTQKLPRKDAYYEQSAKVIEFPRFAAIPLSRASELADPIFDRPRIVEAPEILPPPPALGGMMIEPIHKAPAEIKTDSPAAGASITRRTLAALIDGVVLTTAVAAFAAIFLRFNPRHAPLPAQAAMLGIVTALLWMLYDFLFIVYTGSTPGLRLARAQLLAFDGSPLTRRSRKWRVLASFLSAFSAGLGYLWCVLDQDGLCWHDRITRSNIQPAPPRPNPEPAP